MAQSDAQNTEKENNTNLDTASTENLGGAEGAPANEFDFNSFVDEEDDEYADGGDELLENTQEVSSEPTEPEKSVEEKPESLPQTDAGPVTPEAQTPQTKEQAPAPDAQEQAPQQATQDTLAPAQQVAAPPDSGLDAQYEEFFKRSVEALSGSVYSLDAETKEALDTEPSTVLPKLAANLHMQVFTGVMKQLATVVPAMVPMVNQQTQVYQKAEEQFFTEFPELKDNRDDVQRIAAAYRQANPHVTGEQAIKDIGTITTVYLKKPLPGQTVVSPETQVTTPQPVSPVVPSSAVGGAPAATPNQRPTVWDILIKEED